MTKKIGRPSSYIKTAERLKAAPGAWQVIARGHRTSMVTYFRNQSPDFSGGDYEIAARGTKNGVAAEIWARYVGMEGEYRGWGPADPSPRGKRVAQTPPMREDGALTQAKEGRDEQHPNHRD